MPEYAKNAAQQRTPFLKMAMMWHRRFYLYSLLLLFGPVVGAGIAVAPAPVTLTRVSEILGLSADQSCKALPVRIRGVVTGYEPAWDIFFVQDQTAGVRILAPTGQQPLHAGDQIEVEGVTSPGNFATAVRASRIVVLGKGPFPAPLRIPWLQISTGMKHGQWVEVTGTVRSVTTEKDHAILLIASRDENIRLHLPNFAGNDPRIWQVDSSVNVQGACNARFNAAGEFIGAFVSVPDPKLLNVKQPAPLHPFEVPPIPLRGVLAYRHGESSEHRIMVRGVVELYRRGISLFLTDGESNLYVETSSEEILHPGDRVEVLGFPDFVGGAPALSDAVYRRISPGPAPRAVTVRQQDILNPKYDSGMISTEALLLQSSLIAEQKSWLLQTGNQIFQAFTDENEIPSHLADLEPNSLVQVTGVCIQFRGDDGTPYGLKLRLRTAGDLQLITAPSWWTARRALGLAAILMTSIFAVLGWSISLRRRVRSQTETIRCRIESEAALEKRYRDLIENANDVIFVLDLNGNLKSLNCAGEQISGHPRQEILGKNMSLILAPESREILEEVLNRARLNETLPARELDVLSSDGRLVSLEVSLRVLRVNGSAVGLEGIARDITERKRTENERMTLAEQLRQSQKMEAIGQLAGGVAHDFNNLLTVINGYSEMLLDELAPEDTRRADLEHIKEAGERAASLTSQLLAFSRRQMLQPMILDINQETVAAGKILRRLIGENIEIAIHPRASCGMIMADPAQIQQVILNLAINSRDAMPEGGRLTIETADAVLDEGQVRSQGFGKTGQYVMLTISDTGIGMDKPTQARVFEPFFTTKELGKGTGLGLSTVYGIIKQSGGLILVDSLEGMGTTFRIYFPCEKRTDEVHPPRVDQAVELNGAGTILLVEDEDLVRNLAARQLRQQGYHVLEASNGREALRVAQARAGDIQLLLTDVVMPEMNGKMLADTMKAEQPDLKVLFISGYADIVDGRQFLLDADIPFIKKPFSTDALTRKVRELLGNNPRPLE
jgi:PAS domain S-box-containing protein